ncbi:MAG: hypothetical protein WDN06_07345 [Asticcacaulis sp.]
MAGLPGCGFAPLYAQQGLTANMSQIDIEVPQTRTGYFLEQDLRNGLGSDQVSAKAYVLNIGLLEKHFSVGYRVDETSTRSEITSNVKYTLKELSTGKILYRGLFTETVTYDTSRSPFTGVISQEDAQVRIASAISEKIQTELALYFRGDAAPEGSVPLQDKQSSSSAAVLAQ